MLPSMKFGHPLTPGCIKVMLITEQTVLTYYPEMFEKKSVRIGGGVEGDRQRDR
jgi:hypothetical protein